MRTSVKVLGVAALAGLVVPPIAAAIAKGRMEIVDDPDASEVMLATIFDGEELANRSPEFRGGTTVCWYGGQRLDLRGATLAPEGATLKARCLFGGLQVLVPASWRVTVTGIPIFGGIQDGSSGPDGEGPLLRIEAIAAFSGLTVETQDDDAEAAGA